MKECSIDELYSYFHTEPNNIEKKLEFYQRILGNEFLIILESSDFEGDLTPRTFDTQEGKFLLCYESNEKITNFIIQEVAHVLLSFKKTIALIKNKKIGIALNIGDNSGVLLGLEAVEWLWKVILSNPSEELSSIPTEFKFPNFVDESLLSNLKVALETMSGMAKRVVLAQAQYKDLSESFFLGFIDSPQLFHELIRKRVLDIVKLDKSDSVFVDVAFLSSSTELAAQLSKKGLNVKFPRLRLGNKNVLLKTNTGVPRLR